MQDQQHEMPITAAPVVKHAVGTNCPHCESTVIYRKYKGNDSAYCENCETPLIQVW